MNYETVVGLEVHAELCTNTKIYCGCKNAFGNEVNSNCCEICTGMPGTLPTLNESVVDYCVKMGHALHCKINGITKQDRKNYFYPDLPKAYQISQFDIPLCAEGYLDVHLDEQCTKKRIGVTRIHIEEDAGKLLHDESFAGSLVDFNRCGVPLIEIVSEPDIRSPEEAKAYLEGIKAILGCLEISDCKMQEGSIRCDVNVSVRPEGQAEFGTRCEMKNVNTFSGAMRAIVFERERQIAVLEAGGTITQETRRWDDQKGETVPLRSKEDAQDYRYFPEPDLLTIVVLPERIEALKQSIPELPAHRLERYVRDNKITFFDANLLTENPEKYRLFEETVALGGGAQTIANWINGDLWRLCVEGRKNISDTKVTPQRLSEMVKLIEGGTISNTAAKTVLEAIIDSDIAPAEVVKQKNLAQINDTGALEAAVDNVLAANEKVVADYKGGKTNALGFLVGQCMKATKGQGNPALFTELLKARLG